VAVVQPFGELERAFHVFTRGLEVAATPVAARAPREDVRAEVIRRQPAALGELECCVEKVERRLDARELVAGDAQSKEHVCPLDVRE
jgi:hypothetical protein